MQISVSRFPLSIIASVFGLVAAVPAGAAWTGDGAALAPAGEIQVAGLIRTQRTITPDDMGVCCRLARGGGRYKYFRSSRRNCSGPDKAIVSRTLCPRRPRGDGSKGIVCCEYDTTPGLGPRLVGKRLTRGLMGREKCKKQRGWKVLSTDKCVKKRTRYDRMMECKKRGKDWVWDGRRCKRSAVRDKRGR